ncbi:MAG: mechanosensitive ion channel [Holdemanella sp.]|nr:mechanosensitive ion channel [Holdemanella sp.]
MNIGTDDITKVLKELVGATGLKLLIAILIGFLGFKIINFLERKLKQFLEIQKHLDTNVTNTICHGAGIVIKILVILNMIGFVGIETSGISAIIGALGVCIGLAINGTISNMAGGVMILVTRPFSIGDYIAAQSYDGTVEAIRICHTIIKTPDNKTIYLPNSALSTGTIVNYTIKKERRVDYEFSIAGNDPKMIRKLILEVIEKEEGVLKTPEPFVRLVDFGSGKGVRMAVRVWVRTEAYWDVYHNLLENIQDSFEAKGIVLPVNQIDVYMK